MRSLGYWSCDYNYQLILDISETFNDDLREMSETDQAWLVGKLGDYYWQMFCDDAASNAADELIARLYELPRNQVACLMNAVVNKNSTKPLTYWHCDHELALITDVADTWGWNLQNLSEIDYFWLVARISSYYWLHHCVGSVSSSAEELLERLDELPQNQISALIRAISNR